MGKDSGLKEKLTKANSTLKALDLAKKATMLGLGALDNATDGKVAEKFDEWQDKIDKDIGPKLEAKLNNLQEKLDETVGSKIEGAITGVQKKIDEKGGDKLDKVVQNAADKVVDTYEKSGLKNTVDKAKSGAGKLAKDVAGKIKEKNAKNASL